MANVNIDKIIASITSDVGGVLRNNRFRINAVGLPAENGGVPDEGNITISGGHFGTLYVQSTTTPDHTISAVNIPFRGRQIPFVGDRSFTNWSFTVIDDDQHDFRNTFEKWFNLMQDEESITRSNTLSDLMQDWQVELLDEQTDDAVRTYTLMHCFPVSIGTQELNVGGASDPSQFTVEIAYNYFETATSIAIDDANGTVTT